MSTANTELRWLMEWYASQCNGNWEHQFGVRLETLDNPGWRLEIDLEGTKLEGRQFKQVEHNLMSDVSWLICKLENMKFIARCGPRDLSSVIAIFSAWVDAR
jgi:hypothetical protein